MADVPGELINIKQKIIEMNSAEALDNAPTIKQIKGDITDLDLRLSSVGSGSAPPADPQSAGLVAAVGGLAVGGLVREDIVDHVHKAQLTGDRLVGKATADATPLSIDDVLAVIWRWFGR